MRTYLNAALRLNWTQSERIHIAISKEESPQLRGLPVTAYFHLAVKPLVKLREFGSDSGRSMVGFALARKATLLMSDAQNLSAQQQKRPHLARYNK